MRLDNACRSKPEPKGLQNLIAFSRVQATSLLLIEGMYCRNYFFGNSIRIVLGLSSGQELIIISSTMLHFKASILTQPAQRWPNKPIVVGNTWN